jgi:hypothetical protein
MSNRTSLVASSLRSDPDFFRALLVGLAVGCPLDKSSDLCHLKCDRSGSFDDKIAWVESLNDAETLELYSIHHCCFSTQQSK